MKKIIFGALACSLAFSSLAAEMMLKNDFEKVKNQYEKTGTVSTSGTLSPSDARAELSRKADQQGGDIFVLSSGNTDNKVHGTATVYKKK